MERKIGLDLLRACAIILVVLGHSSVLLNGTSLEGFPYSKPIDGVDLFFVLSGFLIGSILLKEFNEEATKSTLFHFWKRRWFRTLPLYYLFLALNYVFIKMNWIAGDTNQATWHFLAFLQNFSKPFYNFYWESWSLSIEEWFYLLFPLIFLLCLKIFSKKTAFLVGIISMILISLSFRYFSKSDQIDSFIYDVSFRKVVLMRLDSIAFGLLIAWLQFFYHEKLFKLRWTLLLFSAIILIYHRTIELNVTSLFAQLIYLSISPMALSLSIPFFYSMKLGKSWFTNSITFISKISYSMYLINLAIVIDPLVQNFQNQNGLLKYGIAWSLIILLSYFSYRLIEKPITNLRDKKINFFLLFK